jgi:hypothetical protein
MKIKSAIFPNLQKQNDISVAGLVTTAALNVLQYKVIAFDVRNPPHEASEGRIPLKFIP